MARDIEKIYNPKTVEKRWYENWQNNGYFKASVNPKKKPYTIVIPPPNVTAKLHMGHAFNNTLQDILVRYKRKTGYEALWLPGTDHAGIATQTVVERYLKETENKSRHDLGREKFIERVWEWKKEHGSTIIQQLKTLGCSLDWERERFTMDEGLSRAVQNVFIQLYKKGLIYKGQRIVNWDPASGTALADDEVDHIEIKGKLYHIRYKLKNSDDFIVVATTRPETLLGDTGIAVSPDDPSKQALIGRKVIIPIVNREVNIFADEHVDKDFGSGFVKATPAHDPNDFDMGLRHGLDQVIMLDKNGHILHTCQMMIDGKPQDELPIPEGFAGLDRFDARKKIVAYLDKMGLLVKIEDHLHAVGHSYRSHVPIEPYLSEQWFVKMQPLAEKALAAVENGDINFYPKGRFENTYKHWMNNIRDWCISRQLWWGHRIPAWYNDKGDIKVCADDPSTGNEKWTQDPDVLDTWFSSQLWPFSTLGWPDKTADLNYFYPTSTLVTGPDIIFFWVARMVMAGLEFMNDIPFHDVFFNGIVRDDSGRKMSKSLGNGIDPVEMAERYSSDAVRFTLIMNSAEGQDLNLSSKSFESGRNFSNKIWNAYRFLSMNLDDYETDITAHQTYFELADKWILSRFQATQNTVRKNLDNYRIHDALDVIYHFFWGDYCDWYLEAIKPRLYHPESPEQKMTAQRVAAFIMKGSMELLHPFIPFITEEIWQQFKSPDEQSIVISQWPDSDDKFCDAESESHFDFIRNAIGSLRNLRTEMDVPLGKTMHLYMKKNDPALELFSSNDTYFKSLAKIAAIVIMPPKFVQDEATVVVVQGSELFIPLAELIDKDKEKLRLQKENERLENLSRSIVQKLSNTNFVERAPTVVVQKERDKLANILDNLEKVQLNLKTFSGTD